MVTGVMGGREQPGNWMSPLTQIFHAQSELMVAAVERHRTAVLVYGDELLLKASYSYLHDLTLMKQNTSAGCFRGCFLMSKHVSLYSISSAAT